MALLGLALGQGLAGGALCGALAYPPLRARGAAAYRAARGALLGGPGGAAGAVGSAVVGPAAGLLAGAAGVVRAGLGLLLLGASGGGSAGARAALESDGWRAFALVLAAVGAVLLGGAACGLGELVLEAEGRAEREAPGGGGGVGGEAELRLARERCREAAGAARRAAEAEEAAGRREEAMRRQAESTSREYARLSEENLALRDQLRDMDRRAASGAKKSD